MKCQFQAKLYSGLDQDNAHSVPTDTAKEASELLDRHVRYGGYIGGHVEEYVPGIGWCVYNEVEEPTERFCRCIHNSTTRPAQ